MCGDTLLRPPSTPPGYPPVQPARAAALSFIEIALLCFVFSLCSPRERGNRERELSVFCVFFGNSELGTRI